MYNFYVNIRLLVCLSNGRVTLLPVFSGTTVNNVALAIQRNFYMEASESSHFSFDQPAQCTNENISV